MVYQYFAVLVDLNRSPNTHLAFVFCCHMLKLTVLQPGQNLLDKDGISNQRTWQEKLQLLQVSWSLKEEVLDKSVLSTIFGVLAAVQVCSEKIQVSICFSKYQFIKMCLQLSEVSMYRSPSGLPYLFCNVMVTTSDIWSKKLLQFLIPRLFFILFGNEIGQQKLWHNCLRRQEI